MKQGFQDLTEVVELTQLGKIRTVVDHFSLDNVANTYGRMREGPEGPGCHVAG